MLSIFLRRNYIYAHCLPKPQLIWQPQDRHATIGIDLICIMTTLIRIPKIARAITSIGNFADKAALQADKTTTVSLEPAIFAILERI
jgi:hypothetical protein